MSGNWMWGVTLVAAAAHALRVVPAATAQRQVKIPGAFLLLYVAYAVALARGGFAGLALAMLAVEVALRIYRRRRPEAPQGGPPERPGMRRR